MRGEDKKDSVTDGGLIADFLDGRPIDPQKYLREFRLNGSICFGNIRTIVEAQGRLHIRIGDALRLDGLVRPIFPWLAYYREDGGYVAAAPDDFVAAFEGTDWDAEEARVRRLQTAFYWLAIAVNYRGAILWDEAISALAERFPDVDFDEAVELVRRRIDASSLIMRLAIVDGMTYLVADDLFDPESDDIMISEVRQILEAQKHIDPLWPDEAEAVCLELSEAVQERPEVQELIGYLDAHVPAGENDVRYAEECWNEIVVRYRIVGEDVDLVLRSLREEDAFSHLPEAFYDLALAALRVLPCRRLAGHSRASLEAPQGGCE